MPLVTIFALNSVTIISAIFGTVFSIIVMFFVLEQFSGAGDVTITE